MRFRWAINAKRVYRLYCKLGLSSHTKRRSVGSKGAMACDAVCPTSEMKLYLSSTTSKTLVPEKGRITRRSLTLIDSGVNGCRSAHAMRERGSD